MAAWLEIEGVDVKIPQVSEIGCEILEGDALTWLQSLGANAVQCCVTSPPYYGLRDYGNAKQGAKSVPFGFSRAIPKKKGK